MWMTAHDQAHGGPSRPRTLRHGAPRHGTSVARHAPPHVQALGWLALGLTVVVTAALVGGHCLPVWPRQPCLVEPIAGMLLGGIAEIAGLRFIATDQYLDIIAQVGMLLLMFEVGLIRRSAICSPSDHRL